MSIEFNCSQCGKRLSTPDASAGKKARCPECGQIVDVPSGATGETVPPPPAEALRRPGSFDSTSPRGPAVNPYATPGYVPEASAPAVTGELVHSRIEFDQTLRQAWSFFTENLGALVVFGLVIFAVNIVLQIFGQVGSMAVQLTEEPVMVFGFFIVNYIISTVVQTYISLGSVVYALKMLRTRRAVVGDIFGANRFFLRGLGLMIVIGLVSAAVATVCFAPVLFAFAVEEDVAMIVFIISLPIFAVVGIYLWLRFGLLSFYFLVDRDMGIIDAFSASSRYMRGNKLTSFLLLFVTGLVGIAFMCLTCMLGQILYIPFFAVLLSCIYLTATGQPWEKSPSAAAPVSPYAAG